MKLDILVDKISEMFEKATIKIYQFDLRRKVWLTKFYSFSKNYDWKRYNISEFIKNILHLNIFSLIKNILNAIYHI